MHHISIQAPFMFMYNISQMKNKDKNPQVYVKKYKYICGECNKENKNKKRCEYCNKKIHFHKKNIISKFYRKIIKCKICKQNDEKKNLIYFRHLIINLFIDFKNLYNFSIIFLNIIHYNKIYCNTCKN